MALAACGPNMDEPQEVLGVLAQGCAGAGLGLFSALDQRSRFALDAIVDARHKARELILAHYPAEARGDALARLGRESQVESGAQLFAERCVGACRAQLCDKVGALVSSEGAGDLTRVRTVRGGEYLMARTREGRYGIVYETDALSRERGRAFAELSLIKANTSVYAKQKELR
ncbi:MAG TPA: hypothetical protein VMF89_26995 [Polyangiales bacterium]|nr:hypothetical protein [Polyangiales bacterium]